MICWLASYPRSGNTLFRILLNRFFGLRTWSLHGDGGDPDIDSSLAETIGFEPHGPLAPERLAEMEASGELYLVKTHDLPPPDNRFPAICIVRDGRSAIASYWHYRNRPGDIGARLEDVVAGLVQFGGWSTNVAAWLDAPIERRLVVRYEDLIADPVANMAAVGQFLGRAPTEASLPDFEELHALAPHHFRSGGNAQNVTELEAQWPAMFNALHGVVQRRLGYPLAEVSGAEETALQAEITRAIANATTGEAAATQKAEAARRAAEDALAQAQAAASERAAADRAAAEREIAALRHEIEGMRRSPFWQARDLAVSALRAAGLRRER